MISFAILDIKNFVNNSTKPVSASEVAAYLGIDRLSAAQKLSYCQRRGYIRKVAHGLYLP